MTQKELIAVQRNLHSLGHLVRAMRISLSMKGGELARIAGVAPELLGEIESGAVPYTREGISVTLSADEVVLSRAGERVFASRPNRFKLARYLSLGWYVHEFLLLSDDLMKDIAKASGLSPSTLSQWRNGRARATSEAVDGFMAFAVQYFRKRGLYWACPPASSKLVDCMVACGLARIAVPTETGALWLAPGARRNGEK